MGAEINVGTISEESFTHFKNNKNLQEYLDGDAEAPEDVMLDLPADGLADIDDIDYSFGGFYGDGTFVEVTQQDGIVVFVSEFDELEEISGFCDNMTDFRALEEDYVFMSLDTQKGVFGKYSLETDDFDSEKLEVEYSSYVDIDGSSLSVITSVLYEGEELEKTGEHETSGKSCIYKMYDVENQECITTK